MAENSVRRKHRRASRASLLLGLVVFLPQSAIAQTQAAPPPLGSPAATRSLPGNQLPPLPVPFGGKIEKNATQSTPFWQPQVVPPRGAPNVLLIMTDDVGFGAPSTFGGIIPTPNLDRIARMGLRYTNFHSTSLCSPTRAALLTGRNHHSAGFGVVSEQSTGYPGYDAVITKDKATIAQVLTPNGYATSWFGKNHNTPTYEVSPAGPFVQWPTAGLGFDYFYGFMGGDTSQWTPGNLFRNTTQIYPFVGNPGWNLTTAMADEAVDYLRQVNSVAPDKPFFLYFAPGGTHAPHHPTKEWVDRISAMRLFDEGWNKLRERIFANQKKLGVIPANARLSPWPKELLKEWDQLTPDEKKMFIRQVEVYAAYLAYTDHEIGRVIDEVERQGKLDNTLIIYISGDNGGSAEGQPIGTPNEVAMFNGVQVPVEDQLKYFYDKWGTEYTYNHMAVGWAWAFSTPFRWTKQIPNYFGGTRQGVAMAWPARIKDAGGIRTQFHHVIDIMPTILDAARIQAPQTVDGIVQAPIEGLSMTYTWDRANAAMPSMRTTQYFEMMGVQGLYNEGWIASSVVTRPPWVVIGPVDQDPAGAQWELYDLTKDPTQIDNVASRYPEKLTEMKALFAREASRYQVYPLDASVATRLVTPRPSTSAGRTSFNYPGPMTGISNGVAPSILNASYRFIADVEVPASGAEGMIITQGGRFGGYGLYVWQNKPVFVWSMIGLPAPIRFESTEPLAPGKRQITFEFSYDGIGIGTLAFNSLSGIGQGGTGTLKVDGKTVATARMERSFPLILAWDENMDIGSDTGTPVDDARYQVPFAFTGKLNNVRLDIDRPQLSAADIARLEAAQRNNKVSE